MFIVLYLLGSWFQNGLIEKRIRRNTNENRYYSNQKESLHARAQKKMRKYNLDNYKNYNFLACDWFAKVLFSAYSLAKLLSDSLLLDSLLLDSLLSDSLRWLKTVSST